MTGFTYTPVATGIKFMLDRGNFIRVIMGPVGGGKSTVCLMELVKMAGEQAPGPGGVRRTRFIILRNTVAQLKSTIKPIIDTWLVEMARGQMGKWRLTDNIFHMNFRMADGTVVDSEFWLMAADTPDDVRRLLSVECTAAWVEEAREIDREVFNGLQGRVNRYPNRAMGGCTRAGVICSTNAPNIGSFWHEIISKPPEGFGVYIQPPALLEDGSVNPEAENLENLAEDYYANLVSGKTPDWIDVYLRNKFGPGAGGQPIYKRTFRKDFHVAKDPLQAIRGSNNPLIVGMDNGLQAAASIWQMDLRGRCLVLDESYVPESETMGVETFLDTLLVPKLIDEWTFPKNKIVFVVDPACFERSQVNEDTIARAIQRRGFYVIKASTNDPAKRVNAVEGLLGRQIDGKAALLISPKCEHTIAALEWGHRYKTTRDGSNTLIAEKNHHSHMGDAFQYSALHYNVQAGVSLTGNRPAMPVQRARYHYA